MQKISHPHDWLFKESMRRKVFALAFVRRYFSQEKLALLDLSYFELWNGSLTHPKSGGKKKSEKKQKTPQTGPPPLEERQTRNGESHTDVVYKTRTIRGEECYIILLFEHQSTPEPMMPFRLFKYKMLLMDQYLKQGNEKLPLVLPAVF